MGVWVRILMYMAAGALVKAGVPPHVVDMVSGDVALQLALEQGLLILLGLMTGWIALAWRKLALRFGWST